MEQNTENCPYLLADELGVNVSSYPDDSGDFIAWYTTSGRKTHRIYLNPRIDPFELDKAIFILLEHHKENPGQEKYILKSQMKIVNRVIKGISELDHIAANIFLKGSIFNKASLFFNK